MQRIVIVGASGSGKSVLSEQVAQRLGIAYLDLDGLFWLPGWQQVSDAVFRQRVAVAIEPQRWVVGGNYGRVRDLLWGRADVLVWLDYPFPLVMWRLFRRTVKRIMTQENLWDTGNRETWRQQFFSRNSLFLWAIKTHWNYRRFINSLLSQPEYARLTVFIFHKPSEATRWLNNLSAKE